MKNSPITNMLFLVLFMGAIFLVGHFTADDHVTLNDHAMEPDIHLGNVKKYAVENEFDRSVFHLEKAIKTMRVLEQDIDIHAGEVLEETILNLELLKPELMNDEVDLKKVSKVITQSLNALSLAELRVSESYAETNKLDKANKAMNYALMHLKHSLNYSRGELREEELRVYSRLDSLLHDPSLISIDVTLEIDQLIKKLEQILEED